MAILTIINDIVPCSLALLFRQLKLIPYAKARDLGIEWFFNPASFKSNISIKDNGVTSICSLPSSPTSFASGSASFNAVKRAHVPAISKDYFE